MGGQTYLPIEILDYVETHAPSEEAGGFGVTQRELAKALGYHPCSMSRPLADLVDEGKLTAKRASVRDGRRKQLTYRLTQQGRTHLRRETREVPLLSGEIPPPPHPFLGRKEELDTLASFSREGGSLTFVEGAPGMGKTALVSRHLRRARRDKMPFWFTVRPASSPRQFVSALSHALASLGAQQLAYYSQLPRSPVAREVADLVSRSLGDRSLATVVDDYQVAGTDMRRFLEEFSRVLLREKEHLVIIVGQESPKWEIPGVPLHTLAVGGLDRSSAHDLTDRQGGLADRFESVFQATLGSPLLLQLAVTNPDVEADAATLPAAVVRRLPIEEVRTILPIALANEPLPLTFVLEVMQLPLERANELTRTGIIHRTLQGRLEVLQVVRGALQGRVAPSDEREAHLQLATFYSRSRRAESVRERFLHLVAGESWKAAADLLEEQERTVLRLGFSETLRNALRHLASVLPQGAAKVKVLTVEAALLRAHSDYSEAIVSLRRAISESGEDLRTECECRLLVVDLLVRLRQLEEARSEFSVARQLGVTSGRLRAFFRLTEARITEGEGDSRGAQTKFEEAFGLARKSRSTDLALEAIAVWSRLAEVQSGPEFALKLIADALPEAREAGRLDIVFNLLLVRARAYARTGQTELAASEMRMIRAEAEALGYLNQLTYTLSGLATMATVSKNWPEVAAFASQAVSLAERLGNDLVLGHTLAILCSAEYRQAAEGGGQNLATEALSHGLRSAEILNRLPPSESLVLVHAYLTEVYSFLGNRIEATTHYEKALGLADKLQVGWLRESLVSEVGPRLHGATGPSLESGR